jgi:outer membrane protein
MTENTELQGKSRGSGIWIFNIILLAGLIVLYVLHFTTRSEDRPREVSQPAITDQGSGPRIAFIDSDLLMEQYEMVPDMVKSFEASTRGKETIIRERQKEFEQKVSDFQTRLQSGSISMEIAQITEQQLMKEQQELMNLRDELSDELAREEYQMNLELLEIVSRFLESYNQTRQYDLIFNYKQGTNIFVANSVYDITPEVVELLNQEYRLRKPRR